MIGQGHRRAHLRLGPLLLLRVRDLSEPGHAAHPAARGHQVLEQFKAYVEPVPLLTPPLCPGW